MLLFLGRGAKAGLDIISRGAVDIFAVIVRDEPGGVALPAGDALLRRRL
jgi:hypothetical protein